MPPLGCAVGCADGTDEVADDDDVAVDVPVAEGVYDRDVEPRVSPERVRVRAVPWKGCCWAESLRVTTGLMGPFALLLQLQQQ